MSSIIIFYFYEYSVLIFNVLLYSNIEFKEIQIYVGQTSRIVATRFNEYAHSTRVGTNTVGRHFKDQGHNLHHMEMVAIEKV